MTRIKLIFVFCLFANCLFSQHQPVFLSKDNFWVDSVMKTMSNDEKIGQLFMVAAYSNKGEAHKKSILDLIEKYKIGGLMFLQGGPVRQAKLTNIYQSRSKIPLMIAIDAEWGISMRLDSCLRFPWQMTLGAIKDNSLIYDMGSEIARQCSLIGVNINFAPVVDVNSNPNNPIINNRSFGESAFRVSEKSLAYMNGLQDNYILACAKHFPGHGDTDKDSHKTLPVVRRTKKQLDKVELLPYKNLIKEGLGSIMVAHLNIPSLDKTKDLAVSLSSKVVNDLLKTELGFNGLSITDALNMKGVSDYYVPGKLDVKALLAGNDILLFSEDVPTAIQEIKNAIENNQISQKEIDLKCRKILIAKNWMKLDKYEQVNTSKLVDNITTEYTKNLNKKLVESSLTLLNNKENILPLDRLDTLKIASLSIGEKSSDFSEMLSNYSSVSSFSISEQFSIQQQQDLFNKLKEFNLVIISIHKSNAHAWKSYKLSESTIRFLESFPHKKKIVLSIFANPYSINSLKSIDKFDAVIMSYQNSVHSQKLTAQAIFGGIEFNGTLPVSTKHFNINKGISTQKKRMCYVEPYEINFHSSNIKRIDSIVNNAINLGATPGCQILAAKDGKVFFNKSYGYHTYDKKIKVKNSDVYDIASITKIVATVPVLMKMVDEGNLDLDLTLGDYMDIGSEEIERLIIRDILAHQARLFPWIPFYQKTLVKDTSDNSVNLRDTLYSDKQTNIFTHEVAKDIFLHNSYTDSIIEQLINRPLLKDKKYRYSDLGYYLLKELIENHYDKPLNVIVDSFFYKSIGVDKFGYLPKKRIHLNSIIPTEHDMFFRKQLVHGYVHDQGAAMFGGVAGHAGIFSNANDLAKIMYVYLKNGEYAGVKYFSKEVINDFSSCQFYENDNRRGAGFDKPVLEKGDPGPTCDGVSNDSFGHSGFTGTLAWADPEKNIVYIFLSNRIYPDSNNKKLIKMNIRTEIMDIIFSNFDEI